MNKNQRNKAKHLSLDMATSGVKVKAIAETFGVTPETIRLWLRELGYDFDSIKAEKMRRSAVLASAGVGISTIASMFQTSGPSVRKWLKQQGFTVEDLEQARWRRREVQIEQDILNRIQKHGTLEAAIADSQARSRRASHAPVSVTPEKIEQAKTMALAGLPLREIGKTFGVSHESVRLWLLKVGIGSKELAEAKQKIREVKKAELLKKRIESFGTVDEPCWVCDKPVTVERMLEAGRKVHTCSTECREAWSVLRYLTQEGFEKHRIAMAKTVLRNPAKYKKTEIERAYKVLAGDAPPPNRKFFVKGSKPQEYAERYGWKSDYR